MTTKSVQAAAALPPPSTTFEAMFAAPVTIEGVIVYILLAILTVVVYVRATRKVSKPAPHVPSALADAIVLATVPAAPAAPVPVDGTVISADAPVVAPSSDGAPIVLEAPSTSSVDTTAVVITDVPPPAPPPEPAATTPDSVAAPTDASSRLLAYVRASSRATAQDVTQCVRGIGLSSGLTIALCFTLVVAWCVAGDTLVLWPHASKITGGILPFDAFVAVCLAGLAFALILSQTSSVAGEDGDALMNQRVCEELKGWAMLAFLFYHYFGTRQVYNLMRILVSAYVFLTGYGNTLSLSVGSSPSYPSWNKFAGAYLRINLLVTIVCACMGTPYMLYYICMLHTLWTAVTYLLHMRIAPPIPQGGYAAVATSAPAAVEGAVTAAVAGVSGGSVSPLTMKVLRYVVAFVAVTLVWHVRPLWDALFFVTAPVTRMDDSMHEWWFRSKLDAYSALAGCVFAELREPIRDALKAREGVGLAIRCAICIVCTVVLLCYCFIGLPLADKLLYNAWHPYIAWAPIIAFMILRGAASWLRSSYSGMFAFLGRHSLELYLLQFHMWLGASAKSNILLLPSMRVSSSLVHTSLFLVLAVATFACTNVVLAALRTHTRAQAFVCVLSVLVIAIVTMISNARFAARAGGG